MESGNAPKEILKSFIDLASMAKGLMDENQQSSFQRDLERLFPSTRGGGEQVESREPHRVGAGESSASTTTDIILILQHGLPQNVRLEKYRDQKLVETPSKFAISFHVKSSDSRFVTWFMPFLKFGLSRLSFEVFHTKANTDLF